MSAGLALYGLGTALIEPLAPALLRRRLARGKEEAARMGERLGRASLPRPARPVVWLHAASVGETNAVLPMITLLADERPDLALLLTTGTVTSAHLAAARLPPGIAHQFVPLDVPQAVAGFLDHWRPALGIIVESELWPRLVRAAYARGTRLALVNARMSERSHARWRWAGRSARRLLGLFDEIAAQSEADAARYRALGGGATVAGNLKFDGPPPPADPAALEGLRHAIGTRPVFAATSTHPGEEAVVAALHRRLASDLPGLVTLLAPRHPERGAEIAGLADAAGLRVARRSLGEMPGPDTDLYVMDTLGELGLAYGLAGACFVGGSLVPHGGQNPIEPAKLGCPIVHGPHVQNFRDIYAAFDAAGAAWAIADADALAGAARVLLSDRAQAGAQARAASAIVEASAGALARTLDRIRPLLPASSP